ALRTARSITVKSAVRAAIRSLTSVVGASVAGASIAGLSIRGASVLGALDVFAFLDLDDNARAGADERRYHHAHAVVEHRRLVGRGGGLALHYRVGLHHRAHAGRRQVHRDRAAALEEVHR